MDHLPTAGASQRSNGSPASGVLLLAVAAAYGSCPFSGLFGEKPATRRNAVCCPIAARSRGLRAQTGNSTCVFAGQTKSGSDGTRTRDLRRDRPVRGSRSLTTIDARTLYSCGFSGFRRLRFGWLSQVDLRRLLPVCCPAHHRRSRGRLGARPPGRLAHELGVVRPGPVLVYASSDVALDACPRSTPASPGCRAAPGHAYGSENHLPLPRAAALRIVPRDWEFTAVEVAHRDPSRPIERVNPQSSPGRRRRAAAPGRVVGGRSTDLRRSCALAAVPPSQRGRRHWLKSAGTRSSRSER
jgi:hypothetical protein